MPVGAPVSPDVRPVSNEVVIKVAAGEGEKDVARGLKGREKDNAQVFHKLVTTEDKPRAGIETVATGFNHVATWEKTAENMVHSGFNIKGDREALVGSNEAKELADVKRKTGMYVEILGKGLDGLSGTPAEIAAKKTELRGQVRDFLQGNASFKNALEDASGNIPDETIDRILNNRDFQNAVADSLNEAYTSSQLPKDTEKQFLEAKTKFDTLDHNVTRLTTIEGQDKTKLQRLDDLKNDFNTDKTYDPGPPPKSKADVLVGLGANIKVKEWKDAQNELIAAHQSGDKKVVDVAQKKLAGLNANPAVTRFISLSQEIGGIDSGIADTNRSLDATQKELIQKRGERTEAKNQMDGFSQNRREKAVAFQKTINEVLGQSAMDHIDERVNVILQKMPEYKSQMDKAFQEATDKRIQDALQARYKAVKNRGLLRQARTVANKKAADQDLARLIKDVEFSGRNPSAKMDVRKEYVGRMLTEAGFNPKEQKDLLGDDEFVKAQFTSMIEKAYAAHATTDMSLKEKMDPLNKLGDHILEGKLQNFFEVNSAGVDIGVNILKSNEQVKDAVEQITNAPVDNETMKKLGEKKKNLGMLALLLAMGLTTVSLEEFTKAGTEHAAAAA